MLELRLNLRFYPCAGHYAASGLAGNATKPGRPYVRRPHFSGLLQAALGPVPRSVPELEDSAKRKKDEFCLCRPASAPGLSGPAPKPLFLLCLSHAVILKIFCKDSAPGRFIQMSGTVEIDNAGTASGLGRRISRHDRHEKCFHPQKDLKILVDSSLDL
jgi:hypothetical protein